MYIVILYIYWGYIGYIVYHVILISCQTRWFVFIILIALAAAKQLILCGPQCQTLVVKFKDPKAIATVVSSVVRNTALFSELFRWTADMNSYSVTPIGEDPWFSGNDYFDVIHDIAGWIEDVIYILDHSREGQTYTTSLPIKFPKHYGNGSIA